jgi:RHS repeat-associated protein
MIDTHGTVVASYLYDPYGRILSQSGSLANANLYRFSSKEFHVNSGLVYYLYRLYGPNLQRWPNRDPMGEPGFEALRQKQARLAADGPNAYSFLHNQPTGKVDLLGLSACTDACKNAAKSRQGSVNSFACYAGAGGAAGGTLLGGLLGGGKGKALSTGLGLGVIAGGLNWLGATLIGTAGNAAAYVACLSACGFVDNPVNTENWPPAQ